MYKTILVHTDGSARQESRLRAGARLDGLVEQAARPGAPAPAPAPLLIAH